MDAIPADLRAMTPCCQCGKGATEPIEKSGRTYCCIGCLRLEEIQSEFSSPSCAIPNDAGQAERKRWAHLNSAPYRKQFVTHDSDQGLAVTTFFIPEMSCASCAAFLEKIPQKNQAIQRAEVNFARKELRVAFDEANLPLDVLAALLDTWGYPPQLRSESPEDGQKTTAKLPSRLVFAGAIFVLLMLLSFLEKEHDLGMIWVGWASLALSIPVLAYSSSGYLKSAWKALRARHLNMDVPIALGMVVIFIRSTSDVVQATGMGYFDSLAGLAFFLLIGKWYQHSTHSKLAHERDYQSWFPIQVMRLSADNSSSTVPISALVAGDRIRIHHSEIVPADSILVSGIGQIDRAFITGESHPVICQIGGAIEAGGRQLGSAIELEVLRPVEQSELTRLWNSDAFQKDRKGSMQDPVDRISRHFTWAVLGIAALTWLFWMWRDSGIAWNALTSTLIVACPCALALSLPFTYGSVLRFLGRSGAYLKNAHVVEQMAQVTDLVFDKTGTLTAASTFQTQFEPFQGREVSSELRGGISAAAGSSAHPLSRAIVKLWADSRPVLEAFEEEPGAGIAARAAGLNITIGTAQWTGTTLEEIASFGNPQPLPSPNLKSTFSYVSIDGQLIGRFAFTKPLREGIDKELRKLATSYRIHLISGDSDADQKSFEQWFEQERMRFNVRPEEKMSYIESLNSAHGGAKTAMIGDGLNDAGALKQADLGVAVVDDLYAFSPASDLILDAKSLQNWGAMLEFAREGQRTVYLLFAISFLYNFIGLYFAVQGMLTPLIASVLMPISSFTVVSFALGRTQWAWKRSGIGRQFAN